MVAVTRPWLSVPLRALLSRRPSTLPLPRHCPVAARAAMASTASPPASASASTAAPASTSPSRPADTAVAAAPQDIGAIIAASAISFDHGKSKKRAADSYPPPPSREKNRRPVRNKRAKKRERNIAEGSTEDVLRHDVDDLLDQRASAAQDQPATDAADEPSLPPEGSQIQAEVVELSSTGDGLAILPNSPAARVFVVPFTLPGDIITAKVFRHIPDERHSIADLIAVTKPSPLRDDNRVRCRYFGSCGGCQFQMVDYPEQLRHKKRIVERAFRHFSNLSANLLPAVGDTIGSPSQYGYRTKLTPHFDGPPSMRSSAPRNGKGRADKPKPFFTSCPSIGFMLKGRRTALDIEDCPIATDVVRLGMKRERERVQREFTSYQRGATILLRENTQRFPDDGAPATEELDPHTLRSVGDGFVDIKSCISDTSLTATEHIGSFKFTYPASSFFQNNNSILPTFTNYIRDRIKPSAPSSGGASEVRFLIDAYCGAGLFTITLASAFTHSTGIDIAADSIAYARRNAESNGLGADRCRFIAADARKLFDSVVGSYAPDKTVVVLDPPRKGCDADFLAQLSAFRPRRVLYVSCNVHTQARDIGVLVRGDAGGATYRVESIVGFDFFPQTGHVEGVAILERHDSEHNDSVDKSTFKISDQDTTGKIMDEGIVSEQHKWNPPK